MKRVLITGGAGFIGSNLVNSLNKQNEYQIEVVDNLSNGHLAFLPDNLDKDSLMISNFDSDGVIDRVKSGCYDYIVHLAANPRVLYTVEHPYETHQTNVTATMRLLDASRGNIKRFIFASTSAIYGNNSTLPSRPDAGDDPRSPYALQKLFIERYLKLFYNLYGLDSVSLRFFNVFGPNQLGNSPYSTAVSAWIDAIMKGRKMRSDGDGSQTRDMCHVDNIVSAIKLSLLHKDDLCGNVYNVGCNESVSNKEILSYLLKKFPHSSYYDAPWRAGDIMHTLADIDKTKNELGYHVSVPFWEGLDKTIEWNQKNSSLIERLEID